MTNRNSTPSPLAPSDIDDLDRSLDAVGAPIARVRPDQWSGPTPCTDWTVHRLVDHLIGMNAVFVATLADKTPPQRSIDDPATPDPVGAYRDTAAELLTAFSAPGVLGRDFPSPPGSASGAERLQVRLYDLLAHGWDLARAIGVRPELPNDVADRSLAFAVRQVRDQARPGRFGPAQPVDEDAPALDRLVAFLGRPGAS